MECVLCKTENRENAIFCKCCGKKTELKCSHCQLSIPPDSKFCDGCGATIKPLGNANVEFDDKEKAIVEWIRGVLNKGGAENLFEVCIEKFSAILIKEVLNVTEGNKSQAARLLGLSRPTLHSKLEKLLIE